MIDPKILNKIRNHSVAYELMAAVRDYKSLFNGLRRKTFAQHGEDRFVLDYFGHKSAGIYVDIGASHPFRISNTYLLYRQGWRGTTVEPIPRLGNLHRKWRPYDTKIAAAVGFRHGKMTFFEMTPSVLSTLDADVAEQYQRDGVAVLHRKLEIEVVPIDYVFEQVMRLGEIDFVSIDAEGLDMKLIDEVNLEKYRPALVCIEANDDASRASIILRFEQAGYRVIKELGCNLLAAPADSLLLDK